MNRIANLLYFLFGILFPILIGALHTWVHFTELTKPEVQQALSNPIFLMGKAQPLWNTWGVMSFMMGISFIIIGLLNLAMRQHHSWKAYPFLSAIVAMLLYYCCVIYVGHTFQAMPQYYGGIFGLLLGLACLILTWRGQKPAIT
ncbi:MAG: hypothetical protein AAF847_02250 [Bacteroidota bacterium]